MKSRVIFLVLSAILMVMAGCDDNQSAQSDCTKSNIEILSDKLKQQQVKQDSLSKELLYQVDTLTTELKSVKAEIKQLKASIGQKKNKGFLWNNLPMVIGCLALLVAGFACWSTRNDVEEDAIGGLIDDVLNEKIQDKNTYSYHSQPKSSGNTADNKIVLLEQRIRKIEKQLADIGRNKSTVLPIINTPTQYFISKHLYANTNSEEFFTSVVETKQETCVFDIYLSSQTIGEFDLISLDKIKQRNNWDRVVECKGDCTIEEANTFKTEQKGKCELSDGTWKVVEKLKITISR